MCWFVSPAITGSTGPSCWTSTAAARARYSRPRGSRGSCASVRSLSRRRPAQEPDPTTPRRLAYRVQTLRAPTPSHRALAPLVEEALSQSVGPYRNALEEPHDDLTVPAALPDVD